MHAAAGINIAHPGLHNIRAKVAAVKAIKIVSEFQGYVLVVNVLQTGQGLLPPGANCWLIHGRGFPSGSVAACGDLTICVRNSVLDAKVELVFDQNDVSPDVEGVHFI